MARRASEETARITFDDGVTMVAPKYLCLQVVARAQLPERYYVDIKEGAKLYCMCENTFRKLVKAAGIGIDAAGKKLYSVKEINKYLEYCKEDWK